ncbi:MAG: dihydropteroate synthase [Chitinophagales bacterium]|nr:dihydropteroate synthase [Chitinophagales bacterium]
MSINTKGLLLDFRVPQVMAIINLTPDSFYANSRKMDATALLSAIEKLLHEGAAIIDIGAVSSRPGATSVSEDVEYQRLIPIIIQVVKEFPQAILSIDTFRSNIAKEAILHGAAIINDISGGDLDPEMIPTVGSLNVPYICMHMKGVPQNMQDQPEYDNLLPEISNYFIRKIQQCRESGIKDIILDPGFGFGKTIEHNYALLKNLQAFDWLGCPLLVGISRKSMIYKLLDITPEESLPATTALHLAALQNGASILRVHDVKEAVQVIKLWKCIA